MKFNQFSSNKIHFSYFSLNPLCHDSQRAPLINSFSYFHSHPQQKLYSIFHIPKKKFYFFLLSFPLLSLLVTTTFLIFLFSKIEKKNYDEKYYFRTLRLLRFFADWTKCETEWNWATQRVPNVCGWKVKNIAMIHDLCKKKRKKKLQLDLWAKMNRFGSWWRHR